MQDSQEEETPKIKQVTQYKPTESRIKTGNESNIKVSLEELLSVIAAKINIPKEMVFKKSKLPKLARARRIFLYLAVSIGLLTRSQAAELLGISQSAVTKVFNEIEYNEKKPAEIEEILKELKRQRK
jgi:chromosomal replication initiation ATPase DnaA